MTDGTRACATLSGDDTRDYQMHVQREFLISSAVSDRWVRSTGRTRLAASTLIEAIAPRRARAAKETPMKLPRTIGLASPSRCGTVAALA